jgi:hypothetical protein
MTVLVGEGDQDVERDGRQRQQSVGVVTHSAIIPILNIVGYAARLAAISSPYSARNDAGYSRRSA